MLDFVISYIFLFEDTSRVNGCSAFCRKTLSINEISLIDFLEMSRLQEGTLASLSLHNESTQEGKTNGMICYSHFPKRKICDVEKGEFIEKCSFKIENDFDSILGNNSVNFSF